MLKKVSPVFVVVTILVLAISSLMINSVSAQEGALDPNTPISNVDGIMPLAEVSNTESTSEPFAGSGELAPEGAEIAGPRTVAAPVMTVKPSSIIGVDSRIRVNPTTTYPARAVAYLLITWANNAQGSCTGWFIGPRTVATAGHCLYNTAAGAAHGWAKSVIVYAGRNGSTLPYPGTSAHRLYSVTGWTSSGNPAFDYGAIQTKAAIGNTVGYFGWRWQSSNTFAGVYTVQGYPGDKPATQWKMGGAITNVSANRLWYGIDTYGGQSGSPLHKAYGSPAVCCYGFGIHTYGTSVSPYFGNSATRITSTVSTNLTNWRAALYP